MVREKTRGVGGSLHLAKVRVPVQEERMWCMQEKGLQAVNDRSNTYSEHLENFQDHCRRTRTAGTSSILIVPHFQFPESRRRASEVIVDIFREFRTNIGQTQQGTETSRAGKERGVKAP
jgi:hypothetical protein